MATEAAREATSAVNDWVNDWLQPDNERLFGLLVCSSNRLFEIVQGGAKRDRDQRDAQDCFERESVWFFIRRFRRGVRSALLDFCGWLLESIDNLGLGRDGNLRHDVPHL